MIAVIAPLMFLSPLAPFFLVLAAIYEAARWTVRALGRWRGRRAA